MARQALGGWLHSPERAAARRWHDVAAGALEDLFGGWRLGAVALALVGSLLVASFTLLPALLGALERGASDSLFTLAVPQRIVVALISALLIFLLFTLLLAKTRLLLRHTGTGGQAQAVLILLLDGGLTLALFVIALSLAPQVYYSYYVLIFPSLDYKWVSQPLPSLLEVGNLLAPPSTLSLADLLKSIALRAGLLISLWPLLLGAAAQIWFRLARRPGTWAFPPLCGLLAALVFYALDGLSSPA